MINLLIDGLEHLAFTSTAPETVIMSKKAKENADLIYSFLVNKNTLISLTYLSDLSLLISYQMEQVHWQ